MKRLFSMLFAVSSICRAGDFTGINVFNYESSGNGIQTISIIGLQQSFLNRNIYFETPPLLPFTFIVHDRYNGGRFNCSPSIFYSFALLYSEFPQDSTSSAWKRILLPVAILNSSLHYAPFGIGNLHNGTNDKLSGSLFIRSGAEMFVIQKTRWVSISPAAGIALLNLYSKSFLTSEVQLKIGADYTVDYLFNGTCKKQPGVYVKFSFTALD